MAKTLHNFEDFKHQIEYPSPLILVKTY